jgi:carboxyl-terminal processing protease
MKNKANSGKNCFPFQFRTHQLELLNIHFFVGIVFLLFLLLIPKEGKPQFYHTGEQALLIVKTAQKYHYNPKPIDSIFSELVFNKTIASLYPNANIFTSEQFQVLQKHKKLLGENILNKNCDFVKELANYFDERLLFTDSVLRNLNSEKIDFSINDSVFLERKKSLYEIRLLPTDWNTRIKFETLFDFYSFADSTLNNETLDFSELEEIKSQLINRELNRIKSFSTKYGNIQDYVNITYLKSIALAFDPHTNYFTDEEENEFAKSLSKVTFTYGLEIYQNDIGEYQITNIIPGSPAWNSSQINEGDIILSIKLMDGKTQNLEFLNINEVNKIIASDNNNEISFTIRKKNKKEITVDLALEKTEVEENIIQTFILDGEKNIAYIYLPSFYVEMDNINYSINGCANDVARELIKIKNENIDGLILDLRNNGGGSMQEAVDMAGIFIDYGAVGIIDSRDQIPRTIKDHNRGTIFNKPLIVLINNYSASASELFAACMQDHNRAVIVGNKSFGKSTAQEVIPIHNYENNKLIKNEWLKLTTASFYRVSGKTHQKIGIIPDIELPNYYSGFEISERTIGGALEFEALNKKTYYYPCDSLPLIELNKLSKNRINADSNFIYIRNINKLINKQDKQYAVPLNIKDFSEYFYSKLNYSEIYDYEFIYDTIFHVKDPTYQIPILNLSESRKRTNENSKIAIKEDIIITESFKIINDLINLEK